MTDKEFWIAIRRALQMIIKAIERKYIGGEAVELDTGGDVSVSLLIED